MKKPRRSINTAATLLLCTASSGSCNHHTMATAVDTDYPYRLFRQSQPHKEARIRKRNEMIHNARTADDNYKSENNHGSGVEAVDDLVHVPVEFSPELSYITKNRNNNSYLNNNNNWNSNGRSKSQKYKLFHTDCEEDNSPSSSAKAAKAKGGKSSKSSKKKSKSSKSKTGKGSKCSSIIDPSSSRAPTLSPAPSLPPVPTTEPVKPIPTMRPTPKPVQPTNKPTPSPTSKVCVPLNPNPYTFEPPKNVFPIEPWTTEGDGVWAIDPTTAYTGTYSIKSPNFDGEPLKQVSNATLEVCDDFEGGPLVFYAKASVLPPQDVFIVYIDGVVAAQLVDVQDFEEVKLELKPGGHRVDFSYQYNIFNLDPDSTDFDNIPNKILGAVWIDGISTGNVTPAPPADTDKPTLLPTKSPTKSPMKSPTLPPSLPPTDSPTLKPTVSPTLPPSASPTMTGRPTAVIFPSASPSVSSMPSTPKPTLTPSKSPTLRPTVAPTIDPTTNPTVAPSPDPTPAPVLITPEPTTSEPTLDPTLDPTLKPTPAPVTPAPTTLEPTLDPTISPTIKPTLQTSDPTISPTVSPTTDPTAGPTSSPTVSPTINPTLNPTPSIGRPSVSPAPSISSAPSTTMPSVSSGPSVSSAPTTCFTPDLWDFEAPDNNIFPNPPFWNNGICRDLTNLGVLPYPVCNRNWVIAFDQADTGTFSLKTPSMDDLGVGNTNTYRASARLSVCSTSPARNLRFRAFPGATDPFDRLVVLVDGAFVYRLRDASKVGEEWITSPPISLAAGAHTIEFQYEYNHFGINLSNVPVNPNRDGVVWIDNVELF